MMMVVTMSMVVAIVQLALAGERTGIIIIIVTDVVTLGGVVELLVSFQVLKI